MFTYPSLKKKYIIFSIFFIILYSTGNAQKNLDYFITAAIANSPSIKDYNNLSVINSWQSRLDEAQNSSFQVYLTADYLFAPYFSNSGRLISTNPGPKAIGYDAGITNGGLYSALLNIDKNIFNGALLDALQNERSAAAGSYKRKISEEIHDLKKQVTELYLNALQNLELYYLTKEITANVNNQLQITGDLVSKGLSRIQDYLQLRIELKTEEIKLNQQWQDYKDGLSRLYSICGIKDTQDVKIGSISLELSASPVNSQFLTRYYIDSINTAAQQEAFETKYLPQVKLFFNTGLNAVEIENIQRRFGFSAGVNLSLPVLDGDQKSITRQQSIIAQRTIEDYKIYNLNNILIQRRTSEDKIKSLQKNLEDLNAQADDYKKLMTLSLKQSEEGNLTVIEYLTIIRNYIDFQENKISSEINLQLEINNFNYWNW